MPSASTSHVPGTAGNPSQYCCWWRRKPASWPRCRWQRPPGCCGSTCSRPPPAPGCSVPSPPCGSVGRSGCNGCDERRRRRVMLRVCYVSPTYFAPESYVGGGERFAEELARAMAHRADVKLVSFGRRARRDRISPTLERVILRSWSRHKMVPFSPWLRRELRGADVVHCHQYFVLPTFLAAYFGHHQGSRVFVSDLGGGALTPGFHIDQSRWITAHLPISEYAARELPGRPRPYWVIYCGVDTERYPMRAAAEHDGSAVFLGRILPHKGMHYLISARPPGMTLHVVGPALDRAYFARLQGLAAG